MKNIATTFLLCFFAAGVYAQSIPTFCLSLGNSTTSRNLCGTATYDGNYVVGGIVGIGTNQNNFVAKCDAAGNILWYHEEGGNFVDDIWGMIETSDHFIVTVGLFGGKMCMSKYDAAGDEIWEKQIIIQTFDYLYDIIETSDGNYLMTGATENLLSGWYYCSVIKVSPEGNLVWNKNLYDFYHAEEGYSCIETADHRYVIGGYSFAFSNQFFLLSLNEDGVVQWIKRSAESGIAYDMVATSDSGIVAAGYFCTVSGCNAMISKVDSAGNLEWSYSYGDSLTEHFYSIVALPDGGYAMAGDATDFITEYHGFVVKCDSNGQMEWAKITDGREFRSIAATDDGGIIASSTGGQGFGIVKMDAAGNSCPECPFIDYGIQQSGTTLTDLTLSEFAATALIADADISEYTLTPVVAVSCNQVGIEENEIANSTFSVFPDPVTDYLTITNLPAKNTPVDMYIMDVTGRNAVNILSGKMIAAADKTIRVNCSSLPPSMYVLVMNSSGETETQRFIVQH